MDKRLQIIAIAAGLVIIGIVVTFIAYFGYIRPITVGGSSGSSLLFHYSGDNDNTLNATQYTQNGSFAGHMYVEGTSETMLMALRDYNVTAFYYNGSVNTTHMIAKKAYINETGVVTPLNASDKGDAFNVSGIPDGFHDVEFVAFVDPYNFTGTSWLSDGPFAANGVRFNVLVNNSTKPRPAYTDSPTSNDTLYLKAYRYDIPTLTREPLSNNTWMRENVKGDGIVDYYVNLAHPMLNGNTTSYNFTIIQLLDYQQIPIRAGSADTVYYGHLDKATIGSIHMSLRAPKAPGNHKLVVIATMDPYEDLEVAPYVIDNQTWTNNRNISATTTVEHQDIIVT